MRRVAIAAAALGAALVGCAAVVPSSAEVSQPPRFKHVVVVVFENRDASQVLENPAASTFRWLAERYAMLQHYDAVAHPSLPNYLALVSGSTHGIRSDCTGCVLKAPSLADTLAAHSLTWRTYVEDMPPPAELAHLHLPAVKARIPFLFFRDVVSSPRRVRDIVPLADFGRDLRAQRLPSFSLVIPDLCHDMHNCPIRTGNRWLASFTRALLRSGEMHRSVVFIVFDEARAWRRQGGGGRVVAIVAGPLVRRDSLSSVRLSHYSLLRTIEQAWQLRLLGRSAAAQSITGIWRR